MNIKPVGERILIKPAAEERTKGGLYIPDSAKENKKEGEVLAVGTYREGPHAGKELPLKVGEKILYGGYSNEEFEIDGQKYVIVEFKDILATLQK